jgi:uncharacterized OB-fold protein
MTQQSRDENTNFTAASFNAYLVEDKKLVGVRCRSCGVLSPEPRPMCRSCHGRDMEWLEFSGKATLSTFTSISIVPVSMANKGYGRDNPYCTGIVTLEEGPRISARITGVDAQNPQNIKPGIDMVLDLEDIDAEHPTPTFRPA